MAFDARSFFTNLAVAIDAADLPTLREMIHPEFVGFFPQSGERLRGFEAFAAQLVNYPGGGRPSAEIPDAKVIGDEARWAITPSYTVVPLTSPGFYTILMRAAYPDGSQWHVITLVEMRDDKVYRTENFFAPEFDPPEWRRQYAEIVPRG